MLITENPPRINIFLVWLITALNLRFVGLKWSYHSIWFVLRNRKRFSAKIRSLLTDLNNYFHKEYCNYINNEWKR